jgi:Septum formation
MDRRLVGALLVVAVLSAAIVLPLVSGRRVAGTALPIDLPDPPRVGDCLLNPLPASDNQDLTDGTTVDLAGYPAGRQNAVTAVAAFGPCDGPVSGEVVQVVNAGGDPLARRVAAAASDEGCRSATAEYTGLLAVIRQFTNPLGPAAAVRWDPTVNVRHVWVQPEAVQRAAGRTWLACAVTPARPVRYLGLVSGAFTGHSLPDQFGVCWLQTDVSAAATFVDCSEPHRSELVSIGSVSGRSNVAARDVSTSCERLASRIVGRADPTAGGALTVGVDPEELRDYLATGRTVDVTCFLTAGGDRRLVGTLVGLGDRPVPFES